MVSYLTGGRKPQFELTGLYERPYCPELSTSVLQLLHP